MDNCVNCPKPYKKHLPRSIQIDNTEIVMFRKVVIDAARGDDTVVKPENGLYRNVILFYEANDRVYLYDSDGIPTRIKGEIPSAIQFDSLVGRPKYAGEDMTHETDIPDVDATEARLQAHIDNETDARTVADNALQANIDAEETARENAVTTLQGNIDAEETARTTADTTLQGNIDAEATARTTGDATLQTAITTETTARENAIQALDDAKVDKVEGKGLSTNDYDNTEKTQVATNKTNITNLQTGKQDKIIATTATLTVAGWSNKTQTVNVTGVTATNHLIVTTAPSSFISYTDDGVRASAQGNGTVTFTCEETPTEELTANILIIN